MDRRDHRRPRLLGGGEGVLEPFDVPEARLRRPPRIVGRRELAGGILEVEAGGEMAAPAREQHRPHRRIRAERAEGLADRLEHLPIHSVELALSGQLDMGDPAVAADRHSFASHLPRGSPINGPT